MPRNPNSRIAFSRFRGLSSSGEQWRRAEEREKNWSVRKSDKKGLSGVLSGLVRPAPFCSIRSHEQTSVADVRSPSRLSLSLSLLPRGRERLPIAGRSGTKRRNTLGFAVFRFLPWSASLCLPFRSHTPHQHAARARPRQRADLVNAPKVNRPFVPERIDRETSRPRRGEKEASRAINGFLDIDNPRMSRDRAAMRGTEGRRRNGNGGDGGW